eukprot:3890134-Rhodomonas_salina.2
MSCHHLLRSGTDFGCTDARRSSGWSRSLSSSRRSTLSLALSSPLSFMCVLSYNDADCMQCDLPSGRDESSSGFADAAVKLHW